jgi:hypothetical protein
MSQYPPLPPNYPQPPLGYGSMVPSPSPRPTSVTVIAVLAIIFGSLGVLAMCCAMPQYLGVNFAPNPVINAIRADKPLFFFTLATMALGLIISALQLAGGIGSVGLKKWARTALIVYAWARLITGVIELPVSIAYIQPRTNQITMQAMKGNPVMNQPGMQVMMKYGQYFGYAISVLLLIWPMVILYIMTRPHVKAAFEGGTFVDGPALYPPPGYR